MTANPQQLSSCHSYFDKNVTNLVKGIMLILMFLHHFFQLSGLFAKNVSNPRLEWIMPYRLKICVAGFAFLTGYFFSSRNHNYHYSIKKIIQIIIPYWCIFIPYYALALTTQTIDFSFSNFILEFFCIHRSVMIFCWYVLFYIETMLILPLIKPQGSRIYHIAIIILCIFLPRFICNFTFSHFQQYPMIETILYYIEIDQFAEYFPFIIIGYATAHFAIFEYFDSLLLNINSRQLSIIIYTFLIIVMFYYQATLYSLHSSFYLIRVIIRSLKVLSILFFMYGLINILKLISNHPFTKPLASLGKYSLLMWFVHCLFFNITREYTQKILYFPNNAFFILIWGLFLCYILALAFDFFNHFIFKMIDKFYPLHFNQSSKI